VRCRNSICIPLVANRAFLSCQDHGFFWWPFSSRQGDSVPGATVACNALRVLFDSSECLHSDETDAISRMRGVRSRLLQELMDSNAAIRPGRGD
jgi:hypothetical protein